MNDWIVKYYKNSRSDKVVEDFIESQQSSVYAKIARMLVLLSKYGPNLGMPYSKYLKNNLYELRVRDKNEIRIFYVFHSQNTIYLLHAFKKKSQKIPNRELAIAKKRQKELTQI